MNSDELKSIITEAAQSDGDRLILTCPEAFQISAKHSVTLLAIAEVCNEENIRIKQCQLGCF